MAWADGLRAVAILWIVLYHLVIVAVDVPPFDHPKDDWAPLAVRLAELAPRSSGSLMADLALSGLRYAGWLGYQGVHLFIVLSGFGLTWSALRRGELGRGSLRRHYTRRLLRLLPLYWIAHLLFLGLQAPLGGLVNQPTIAVSDARFWLSMAGMRALPATFSYIAPAWWYVWLMLQLYFVYPWLERCLARWGAVRYILGALGLTVAVRATLILGIGSHIEMWSMGAFAGARLFEFALGMGLASWLYGAPDRERWVFGGWRLAAALAIYLAGLVLSFSLLGSLFAPLAIATGLIVLLGAAARAIYSRVPWLVRPSQWLGALSYGVMLLHQPLVSALAVMYWGRVSYGVFAALFGALVVAIVAASWALEEGVRLALRSALPPIGAGGGVLSRVAAWARRTLVRIRSVASRGATGLGLALLLGLVTVSALPEARVRAEPAPSEAQMQPGRWHSAQVGLRDETHRVDVYLPSGYNSEAAHPVIYLLHGWTETPDIWHRADVQREADVCGVLLVAPQGDGPDVAASWYSPYTDLPYPNGSQWKVSFLDWFLDGLLPWVDQHYATTNDAAGRGIAGYSMGGKGALSIAAHAPDRFVAVASIAGVTDLRDYAQVYEVPQAYGPLDMYPWRYAADNPLDLAPNLKGLSVALIHGLADTYWVHYAQSRAMARALDGLGYPYTHVELPGLDHDLATPLVSHTFSALCAAFGHPPRETDGWRYRFSGVLVRRVYDTTITKTRERGWTEVLDVSSGGLRAESEDAFHIVTAMLYEPGGVYRVTVSGVAGPQESRLAADDEGRLSLSLPAGSIDVRIDPWAEPEASVAIPLPTHAAAALAPLECALCRDVRLPLIMRGLDG